MTDATDSIAEAITEHWGERCPDFEAGCFCCQAWSQYDDLVGRRAEIDRLRELNGEMLEALEAVVHVYSNIPQQHQPHALFRARAAISRSTTVS